MLELEGESIDLRVVSPEAVPDEDNFCAIPALKDLASYTGLIADENSPAGKAIARLDAALPHGPNDKPRPTLAQAASLGTPTDLKAWADWLREEKWQPDGPEAQSPARQVLADLSRDDALVSELAEGLSRPESQWTPPWKTRVLTEPLFKTVLPHYSAGQMLVVMLCLRSVAAARAGDAAEAQESMLIAVRIDQAFNREPVLIGTLVEAGAAGLINGGVWELCDAHAGTEEEFRRLQEALSALDFQAAELLALRGELAMEANAMEYLKQSPNLIFLEVNSEAPQGAGPAIGALLAPAGWFDGNAAAIAEMEFAYAMKPLRDGSFADLLAGQQAMAATLEAEKSQLPFHHLDEVLALELMPAVSGATRRVIYAQSMVNQAIAACALERYRIEHGSYPDTLEQANRPGEKSIPLDVLSGKPMGYRKTADGRYALWCVSFNGTDHGGVRVLDKVHPENTKFSDPAYKGDWVWDFTKG
jgi:hypothetical protein